MNTPMKIKVSVQSLIQAIEARRAELVAEQAAALNEYPAAMVQWRTECKAVLTGWLSQVEAGEPPDTNSYGKPRMPYLPVKPSLKTEILDRDLATLKMASEPTISISAEDYARYVR